MSGNNMFATNRTIHYDFDYLIDPYTDNTVLKEKVISIAMLDAAASFGTKLAMWGWELSPTSPRHLTRDGQSHDLATKKGCWTLMIACIITIQINTVRIWGERILMNAQCIVRNLATFSLTATFIEDSL
jgi:hypothetical protein